MTIGEVSERTGLSAHTLRFYEQQGLLVEPVRRDSAGRRTFSEQEVGWLKVCVRLRDSDMPLPDIRRYAEQVRRGEETVAERLEILREHQIRVRRRMAELQHSLDAIDAKVGLYEDRLKAGSADKLWRDGPECVPVSD
jgi:DNA-binding transcriptional MerR regulator